MRSDLGRCRRLLDAGSRSRMLALMHDGLVGPGESVDYFAIVPVAIIPSIPWSPSTVERQC